jgi:hypothetical protein
MSFRGLTLHVGMATAQQQTPGRTHACADETEIGGSVE